uniref:Uncharacterized protein n=1 Tax=Lactuca sativa TaxID=4236 RepID=A0A9R1WXH3_LACSA|nr:hypothetical protein LSAT_V11C800405750 [Lactuca sativa]
MKSFPAQIWSWYVSYNGMSSSIPKNKMELLEMLVALVFNNKKCSPLKVAYDIQSMSFNWIKHKSSWNFINWFDWCVAPCSVYTCNFI